MIMPKMIEVKSSNIDSVGYDKNSSTLFIQFHDKSTYLYHSVPEFEFKQLLIVDSVGSYFANNIKNNYSYEKL